MALQDFLFDFAKSASPSKGAFSVSPADSDLPQNAESLYVGTSGDVRVNTLDGDDVKFVSVPAGTVLPIQVERVWGTGTTATDIIAFT